MDFFLFSPFFPVYIIINIGNTRTRYIHYYAWGKWRHFIIFWRQLIGRSPQPVSTPPGSLLFFPLSHKKQLDGVREGCTRKSRKSSSPRFVKPPAIRGLGGERTEKPFPILLLILHTHPREWGGGGGFSPPSLWALSSSPSPPLSTRLFVHPPLSLLFSRMPPATSFSLLSFSSSFFFFFFLLLFWKRNVVVIFMRCLEYLVGRRLVAAK